MGNLFIVAACAVAELLSLGRPCRRRLRSGRWLFDDLWDCVAPGRWTLSSIPSATVFSGLFGPQAFFPSSSAKDRLCADEAVIDGEIHQEPLIGHSHEKCVLAAPEATAELFLTEAQRLCTNPKAVTPRLGLFPMRHPSRV